MKCRMVWWSAGFLFVFLLAAVTSHGAGFALYEGSARGQAMGHAVVGSAADPSVLYYNAAGMTELKGAQVGAGAVAIGSATEVTTLTPAGPVTTDMEDDWWIVPSAYTTYEINDKVWAGVGVYSRFGLGASFPETWPGRYNSYSILIQSMDVNPNVAVKVNDKLSVAAGVSAVWFDYDRKQMLPTPMGDVPLEVEGDSVGYGGNVAMRYEVLDWMAFGASYQSEVDETVDGTADAGVLGSTDASGDVTLPDFAMFGLYMKCTEKLGVEVGAIRTGWSSLDQLAIDFADPSVLGVSQSVEQKDWADVWRYSAGVEYALRERVNLRAGYIYDETPDPDAHADYLIPANDRHAFSVGAGWGTGAWTLDVSYTYVYVMDRSIPGDPTVGVLPSEFENGQAHLLGASVSAKL